MKLLKTVATGFSMETFAVYLVSFMTIPVTKKAKTKMEIMIKITLIVFMYKF